MNRIIHERSMTSPIGPLKIAAHEDGLDGVHLPGLGNEGIASPLEVPGSAIRRLLDEAEHQLQEYFAGAREVFELPLAPSGTAFQMEVWKALQAIPFGETRSYGQIARGLGKPGASRAVGLANARNPLAIIVPCHRVIGADGTLTGYGGGLERKRLLLDLESGVLALLV